MSGFAFVDQKSALSHTTLHSLVSCLIDIHEATDAHALRCNSLIQLIFSALWHASSIDSRCRVELEVSLHDKLDWTIRL